MRSLVSAPVLALLFACGGEPTPAKPPTPVVIASADAGPPRARFVKGEKWKAAAEKLMAAMRAKRDAVAGDKPDAKKLAEAALAYREAAALWREQKDDARAHESEDDAYEAAYFYADAAAQYVLSRAALVVASPADSPEPTPTEIEEAKRAAIDVRDSPRDDKYLADAALLVVAMADVLRDSFYRLAVKTAGAQGAAQRTEPRLVGAPGSEKVAVDPIPAEVSGSIAAREDYVRRVPAEQDTAKRAPDFVVSIATTYFAYGHFDEARKIFEVIYREQCGRSEAGYHAWAKLVRMSLLSNDADRAASLAQAARAHTCAVNEMQRAEESTAVGPILFHAAMQKARDAMANAKAPPDFATAAAKYEAALAMPAPWFEKIEAAVNAAYGWKQAGDAPRGANALRTFLEERTRRTEPVTPELERAACTLVSMSAGDAHAAADAQKIAAKLKAKCPK